MSTNSKLYQSDLQREIICNGRWSLRNRNSVETACNIEGMRSSIIKPTHDKLSANVMLNGGKLGAFCLKQALDKSTLNSLS